MPDAPLLRRDYLCITLLFLLVVAAGVMVEWRSAFMKSRHTDLGCYLRGAWGVSSGENPYRVPDDNGWHFAYPVVVAIALVPFADAPTGHEQPAWAVPYPVTVGLWYVFSMVLLAWSIQHLCRALEDTRPGGASPAPIGGRRFWWTRTWPMWICLPAIGSTVSRGQVNLIVLAPLAGFIAAALRGRRATAGWWLAAATCVKVIPALLVLYPLVRRDWRMLGHFALGTFVGIVVIPAVVLGPERAYEVNVTYLNQTLLPGLTTRDGHVSRELTDMTATDNQSLRAIIHNAINLEPATRPAKPAAGTKVAHAVLALAMLVGTFLAARRIPDERYRTLFLLSALIIVMVAITPVNHTHYMAFAVPAVLGLVYWDLERHGTFRWGPALVAVVALHIVSGFYPRLPFLPGYQIARDLGISMLGTLVVWFAVLWLPAARARRPTPAENANGLRLPGVSVFK